MRTDLQIEASRANGSKSRGPLTEEGKLASSRNALKHGILSEAVVLYGESEADFQTLTAHLFSELDPANGIEEDLVNTMAVARWRRTRIWQLEKSTLEAQMEREYHREPAVKNSPATLCALAFRSLSDNSRSLDLINRYESRYDRQYLRAHKRLLDLRKNPQPVPPADGPAVTPIDSAKRTQDPLPAGPAAISRGSGPNWLTSFTPRRNILTLNPRQPLHLEPPSEDPISRAAGDTQPAR